VAPFVADDAPAGSSVSPATVAILILGTLAFISPWTFDSQMLTQCLGGGAVLAGVIAVLTLGAGRDSERLCNLSAAVLGALILAMATWTPGLLRSWWAPDPSGAAQQVPLVAVPVSDPSASGKVLGEDDWVAATTDAIRQGNLLVVVDAVATRSMRLGDDVAGGKAVPVVTVQVRLVNVGTEELSVAGFAVERGKPRLTDEGGKTLRCLEVQAQAVAKGKLAFDPEARLYAQLAATGEGRSVSYLFIFDRSSAPTFDKGKLEIPAVVWNQQGTCRFLVPGNFERPEAVRKS